MIRYLKAKAGSLKRMMKGKSASIIIDPAFWMAILHQVNKNVVYRFAWPLFVDGVRRAKRKDLDKATDFCFNGCLGLIRPLQVRSEILALAKIAEERKPRTVVEIGTCNGGTLFLLSCVGAFDANIVSIDLPYGEFGGGYPEWAGKLYQRFATGEQKIHLIKDNSHEERTLRKLKSTLGSGMIDVLFIDGDHTYEGVKRDFELYSSLVRRGGIIALHDVAVHKNESCQVSRFWEELKRTHETKEIIERADQGWGGIGIVYV